MVHVWIHFSCIVVLCLINLGVEDGQKLRIKGEGDAGLKGGEPGKEEAAI